MNEEIKLEPLHYVPYIYYFNILTGEVALSNNEYLWLSKNPATIQYLRQKKTRERTPSQEVLSRGE